MRLGSRAQTFFGDDLAAGASHGRPVHIAMCHPVHEPGETLDVERVEGEAVHPLTDEILRTAAAVRHQHGQPSRYALIGDAHLLHSAAS